MRKLAALLGAVLMLTACSQSDHNDADVEFATAMIEHHAQAIQMANYTIGREGIDPRIAELAEEIRVSQTEEIDTFAALLRKWEEPVPETGFATGDSHSHDDEAHGSAASEHSDMPGMMSAGEMESLSTAPDAQFERMWLESMVEHHEGALEMVSDVRDAGESSEILALADEIEGAQAAEVKDMRDWMDAV